MSLKNLVTPAGIDPGTDRLVAQRLNHYATPGPQCVSVAIFIPSCKSYIPITFSSVTSSTLPYLSTVEMKCQLDATDEFLLLILLLAQHVSGHLYAHHQEL
jgi:hypothetical protein